MATNQLTLELPESKPITIDLADDQYILEAAEEQGLLPYSCRAGACSIYAGKIKSGSGDQSLLDNNQIAASYVLTCAAYPTSDSTITTHR